MYKQKAKPYPEKVKQYTNNKVIKIDCGDVLLETCSQSITGRMQSSVIHSCPPDFEKPTNLVWKNPTPIARMVLRWGVWGTTPAPGCHPRV